ncbi:MAG: hypothetical protein AAFY17_17440, partial [Cyanobacteria bacterium J06642_11]
HPPIGDRFPEESWWWRQWGDELKSDPDVAAMVERRWAEYGLGDLEMGEADPNLFGYDIR